MSVDYPHDGSEVIGTFQCARGNCGVDIGHPANQDQHNNDAHLETPASNYANAVLRKWDTEGDPWRGRNFGGSKNLT